MFVNAMALTRPSLTMQLTSGVGIFAHVCGQRANTLSNYCESDMTRGVSVFVKRETIFRLFFFLGGELPQIQTSNFWKVVWQHTEGMV